MPSADAEPVHQAVLAQIATIPPARQIDRCMADLVCP